MAGSLFELVKRDSKRFINNGGYEVDLQMTTPDGTKTINFTGWGVKHHISFDTDGNQVNSKNARATVDEAVLESLNYPVRNAQGNVTLLKHLVSYKDSSGIVKNYIVRENFPDENLGLILLILGDYKV
jgi:hypothetical protein